MKSHEIKNHSRILAHLKYCLVRKVRLISKFLTSQPEKQSVAIHILPNMSRRKSNQTKKFGQLVEYNMKNIFLEKLYTKCGTKISTPDSFLKNQNWAYLCVNSLKFYSVCFVVCQIQDNQNILNVSCKPVPFFLDSKLF